MENSDLINWAMSHSDEAKLPYGYSAVTMTNIIIEHKNLPTKLAIEVAMQACRQLETVDSLTADIKRIQSGHIFDWGEE